MSCPEIPPDVVESIVNHLHGDPSALKACSLTCKSWVASSQYHLFSRIVLLDNPQATSHNLNAWSETFPPTTGIFVRSLKICQNPSISWTAEMEPQPIVSPIGFSKGGFSSFTKLRHLELDGVTLEPFRNESFEKHFGHISSTLHSLTLRGPLSPISMCLICTFYNLDDLTIEDPGSSALEPHDPDTTNSPSFKGKLLLKGYYDRTCLLFRLHQLPGDLQFSTVIIQDAYMENGDGFGQLMSACSSSIEVLTVMNTRFDRYSTRITGKFTALRIITVDLRDWDGQMIKYISWILGETSSEEMTKVTFVIDERTLERYYDQEGWWKTIDTNLVRLKATASQLKVGFNTRSVTAKDIRRLGLLRGAHKARMVEMGW